MHTSTWLVPVQVPWAMKDFVKAIPGVVWNPERKRWLLPREVVNFVVQKGREQRQVCIVEDHQDGKTWTDPEWPSDLYDFQKVAATAVLHERRGLLNFDMGLGKTRTAIEVLKYEQVRRILIVTPAIVRSTWRDEISRWWPGRAEDVGIIHLGRNRKSGVSKKAALDRSKAYAAEIQVVSFALLDEIDISGWDALVVDESHRIKDPEAAQSVAVKKISIGLGGNSFILLLTGTVAPDRPIDVWNQIDTLWPGRFGSSRTGGIPWKFKERYSNQLDNGYGTQWFGVNKEHAAELAARIGGLSSRATKAEWAHLLPPFLVQMVRVPPTNGMALAARTAFENFEAIQSELNLAGQVKATYVKEWLENAQESGAKHCCILTHLRETAEKIAAEIPATANVFCITGEMPAEERNRVLALAKKAERAVIVATMHSVGIGIDLTFCTQAVFVELDYKLGEVLQAIGRFHRLSSQEPANVTILAVERTVDEIVASKLLAKMEAINKTVKAGDSEERLSAALGGSNDDWLADLNIALGVA